MTMVLGRVEHFSPFPGDVNQEFNISCEIAVLPGNWERSFFLFFLNCNIYVWFGMPQLPEQKNWLLIVSGSGKNLMLVGWVGV